LTPLLEALGIRRGDVVSIAGAGGKTTLIYRLAAEARAEGWTALVTTTTHMGRIPEASTGPVWIESEIDSETSLEEALRTHGTLTLLGSRVRSDKLRGIAPERVDALAPRVGLLLVESDGARGRSLKLPADHEPVVPRSTTLLVVVAALDVLGQPLDARSVHRLGVVLSATGRPAGAPVDEDTVVAALRSETGYPSRVPGAGRSAVFLNKVEGHALRAAARRIAARLVPPYGRVAAGSARAGEAESWS
jgi:molybdenum cofactor cytidylyltransferase